MTVNYNISEDIPYDLSLPSTESTFALTDIAYDVVIDDLPFIVSVNNQNPYRRETAPYKKDQFDNSPEPGEQSLTGWWLRSQTSWHNGAGISFYEPGTDYEHVSHRFNDSRGVDIWTVGEVTLLPEVVDVYTGKNLINATVGSDGADVLVSGDSAGVLRKISFTGDSQATTGPTSGSYTIASHTSFPFKSVTSDGSKYYAACTKCVHSGVISADSDVISYVHSTTATDDVFIKYVKGYVLLGTKNVLTNLHDIATTTTTHSHGSATIPTTGYNKTHLNTKWIWNDATAGPSAIYASGNGGSNGEVWQILFDEATNSIDMAGATMVISLPDGETVNAIHYYLGVLALGTSRGLRICPINVNGQVILGPLLYENGYYPVNGFTESGNYIYAATKTDNEDATFQHACLIRVDLSTQFNDGSYAFAHDLEYRSSVNETYSVTNKALTTNVATLTTSVAHNFNVDNTVTVSGVGAPFDGTYTVVSVPTTTTFTYAKTATNVTSVAATGSVAEASSSSEATEVYQISNRMVMVVEEENGAVDSGELHIQSATLKRDTGWIKTGKIRYGTVEPKFFKYINLQCTTGQGDNIEIYTINKAGSEAKIATVSGGLSNKDILIDNPSTKQEFMAFKFVFNNVTNDQALPVLEAYQIKSIPSINRQRLYQYPLSCYDNEMDRYNSVFGYDGRAMEFIQRIESLEQDSKFVYVTDYRTGEQYEGIIEEVRFTNESSPDKNSSGFGGILLVTVRKM
jgi:hypothetical protein